MWCGVLYMVFWKGRNECIFKNKVMDACFRGGTTSGISGMDDMDEKQKSNLLIILFLHGH